MKNENDFNDLADLANYLISSNDNSVKFECGYINYDGKSFHVYNLDINYFGAYKDINIALDTVMLRLSPQITQLAS